MCPKVGIRIRVTESYKMVLRVETDQVKGFRHLSKIQRNKERGREREKIAKGEERLDAAYGACHERQGTRFDLILTRC